jgi:hypothetical protein
MKTWSTPEIKELNFNETAGDYFLGQHPDGEYIEFDIKIFCWETHISIPKYS